MDPLESKLTPCDFAEQFGTSMPAGNKQINSYKGQLVSTSKIYCHGDLWVYGRYKLPIEAEQGLVLPTSTIPSIAWNNSGIYSLMDGSIVFSVNGTTVLTLRSGAVNFSKPITSDNGNLLVDTDADFNGHTITNAVGVGGGNGGGGIPANPNRYEVIAPSPISTTDDVFTTIYTIPINQNTAMTISSDITCATSSGATGGFIISAKAKNIAGVVTVSRSMETNIVLDADIISARVQYFVTPQGIAVQAKGVAGITIRWFGATTVTKIAIL